jgi:hypothetical protein
MCPNDHLVTILLDLWLQQVGSFMQGHIDIGHAQVFFGLLIGQYLSVPSEVDWYFGGR